LLLVAVAAFSFAQTFEVATIHQAAAPNAQDLRRAVQAGTLRIGQQISGNQVSFNLMPLRSLAAIVYDVKPLQITGPDWIGSQAYNITALMPEGSDPTQIPAMLQALLKDRFKLVAHKTDAAQDVYALQVAKDGHKMKVAPVPTEPAADAAAKPGERSLNIGGQQITVNQAGAGAGSAVVSSAANGAQKISMTPDGKMHMEIERMTMAQLAETLTPMMDFPVVDRTGLTGAFSLALDMSMADIVGIARKAGVGGAIAGLPAGAAPAGATPGMAAADPGGDLTAAVQKLGLRLDKQKAPVAALVIESAEKTPTEN
ncbi:MAG: TIGR03435 family protein, partial [Bryobacteraceae bacterium]